MIALGERCPTKGCRGLLVEITHEAVPRGSSYREPRPWVQKYVHVNHWRCSMGHKGVTIVPHDSATAHDQAMVMGWEPGREDRQRSGC